MSVRRAMYEAFKPDNKYSKALRENYWTYQVPVLGRLASAQDSSRYWDDYYKNTGFRPRYPGRVYGTNAFGGAVAESKTYFSAKKIYG